MTMITREQRYDYADHLHRITQFRKWIDTNILFPTIPDANVRPLREQLIKIEVTLAGLCYVNNELDKVTAMQKVE